jgi:hypothetical protein
MAMARREQMRTAMLPHLAGKFDVERFLRTGFAGERRSYPLPMTPTMIAAIEDAEREAEALKARLRNGG